MLKFDDSQIRVLLTFRDFPQLGLQILKFISSVNLELLRSILVERVLLLEELHLLTHVLDLSVIASSRLFDLSEDLCILSQFQLQEVVCLDELITFSHCHF